jgi:hypothetical protein
MRAVLTLLPVVDCGLVWTGYYDPAISGESVAREKTGALATLVGEHINEVFQHDGLRFTSSASTCMTQLLGLFFAGYYIKVRFHSPIELK